MLRSPFSSLCVHGRGKVQPFSLLIRGTATNLDRWQRRCDRLTQLQGKIRFPPLQTLTVNGRVYELPLSTTEPVRLPSQEELEYLAGFFDGDGCVTFNASSGQVEMKIDQAADSAWILLHFRSLLGGGVYRGKSARGAANAAVSWIVSGSKMTNAAATLSKVPSMKQAQLLIAAKASTVAKGDRARVGKELKMLKQPQHRPDQSARCLWRYFAGFFDAEGCVHVDARCVGLRLKVNQVNPVMLVQLLRFLHKNTLCSWTLYDKGFHWLLACSHLRESKATLELLLANGLIVKREQAELALSLTAENHLRIRDAISSLNGLQGRYQRLDSAGVARAREIQRLQSRLRYFSAPERGSMLSKLEELRAEHNLQKLISRCDLLRRDMRRSLREGGRVVSANAQSS